jgi:DNA topoisomerase-1
VAADQITIEQAQFLLSLPHELGLHPDDGAPVLVSQGRFGPYVQHNKDFRSIKAPLTVFSVTFEDALRLLSQPKNQRTAATVLRELGPHPETGEPVNILEGRYGPFIKFHSTNVSIPKDRDIEELSLDEAVQLIAEKKAKKPGRTRKSTKTRKAATGKKTTRKTTKKKTT